MPVGERTQAAVEFLRSASTLVPEVGLILGTGLGGVGREMDVDTAVPYHEIPGFPPSTVESHAGRLLFGRFAGRPVVALQGRWHRYEGNTLKDVAFPVRAVAALGTRTLVVSNACGGLRPEWEVGDLLLLGDHLNLLGGNPLVGPHDPAWGPRFPELSEAYDGSLRRLALAVAARQGTRLHEGVYAAVAGPSLETPAEYRMLKVLGADAVGMSTVPEVIVARQAGLRVFGVGIITDRCLPDALEPVELSAIIAAAEMAEPALTRLLEDVLQEMDG